ncbi:MAG TPA: HAD hydrolase family protein [Candidatus Eisenbergiella merdipullorum]|uniref:HAD hydrolase family protein n=1 Tax=Candidatus Eisenbergiella merdipullorum TaxID=2838553 RepID=A0A9D2I9A8_9FIRM|nr:HAD hydrolase family protein [Candidatus Eisenbergiella merdipullorum]
MISAAQRVCGAECEITVDTPEGHFWNYKQEPLKTDPSWGESIYTDFRDFSHRSLKMCVEIFSPEQAKQLKNLLPDCDCARFSDGKWYKFMKKTATKERAILRFCAVSGISAKEIIAFGDDYVDIGMLKLCGLGIAMENAIEDVKKAADRVIADNEEDGIAEFLEENVLSRMQRDVRETTLAVPIKGGDKTSVSWYTGVGSVCGPYRFRRR